MPLATAGPAMGDAVISAMDAVVASYTSGNNSPDVKAMRVALVRAMMTAVCQQIVANAVVTVTGVQVGGGAAPGLIT